MENISSRWHQRETLFVVFLEVSFRSRNWSKFFSSARFFPRKCFNPKCEKLLRSKHEPDDGTANYATIRCAAARETGVSGIMGAQLRASLKPLKHHDNTVPRRWVLKVPNPAERHQSLDGKNVHCGWTASSKTVEHRAVYRTQTLFLKSVSIYFF